MAVPYCEFFVQTYAVFVIFTYRQTIWSDINIFVPTISFFLTGLALRDPTSPNGKIVRQTTWSDKMRLKLKIRFRLFRLQKNFVFSFQADHEIEKVNELSREPDPDSKDRELEHIDAIVSESKYVSKTSLDRIDTVDHQPKQNGSALAPKTPDDHELKKNLKQDLAEEEEEENSCCGNCFMVVLNECECVIL